MENKPLVSVVLPVYNRESVVKTIESILSQTYENFELIIVDNASTDKTVEKIKSISDKRVELIQNKRNIGQTSSLNVGIRAAKGKYIARIDSDDIALPNRFEKQVTYMEEHNECVICGSWIRIVNDSDDLSFTLMVPEYNKAIKVMMAFGCPFFHPSVMLKSEVIKNQNIILYNTEYKYAQDYEMWSRVLEYGMGHNIPEVLTYYRRGDNNESRKKKNEIKMRDEVYRVELYVRNQLKSVEDKNKLIAALDIEKKQKCVLDMLKLLYIYYSFIYRNFKYGGLDYKILVENVNLKLYRECIYFNNTLFSRVVEKMVRKLKNMVEYWHFRYEGKK